MVPGRINITVLAPLVTRVCNMPLERKIRFHRSTGLIFSTVKTASFFKQVLRPVTVGGPSVRADRSYIKTLRSYFSPAPQALPHAAGFSAGLSAAPQAEGASAGLSPAPQALPHAAGFSSGLSAAPQAEGASAGLSPAPQALPAAFLFHPTISDSAIIIILLQ